MPSARFEFLPDLDHFLAPGQRAEAPIFTFDAGQSVKHLIEAAGAPHTEVGQVQVNQSLAAFDYQVQEGDHVTVYPPAPGQDLPSGGPRFVLDNHLGRLAAYLRMLGFDALYRNDLQDEELAQIASREERILLTRDRRLLMRRIVRYGYCPRSLVSSQQAGEVIKRYDLAAQIGPFQRCLRCNAPLEPVSKAAVLEHLEPLTRLYYNEFHRCPACGQVYWKGSHYEHMQTLIDQLRSSHTE